MKRLLFLFILMSYSIYGCVDENKYFKRTEEGDFISLSPLFEPNDPRGERRDPFQLKKPEELANMLKTFTEEVFSQDEIKQLTKTPYVWIYFNYKGEIEYMHLGLGKNDAKIFTDQKLYKLYQLIKKQGINMQWGSIFKHDWTLKDSEVRIFMIYPLLRIKDANQ